MDFKDMPKPFAPKSLKNRFKRQIFYMRTGIMLFSVGTAVFLSFVANRVLSDKEEPPPEIIGQTETTNNFTKEEPGKRFEFTRQALEEMFATPTKTQTELSNLIADMDTAIEAMNALLAEGEATSDESCDLLEVILHIDALILQNKNGDLNRRAAAFLAAIEQDILGQEFNPVNEAGVLAEEFDYTVLDESILDADFDQRATATGQELKQEVIQLRQRAKKIASQTQRLSVLDARVDNLDPACQPTTH